MIDLDAYVDGVRAGDRTALGRAITLVESTRADHQAQAQELLTRLLPYCGASERVGITGVPGVGKSTFIEAVGSMLTGAGRRVAVLAVDPSSTRTGGSILGDKTRMQRLSTDPAAFIRPSPTSGNLGGVGRATRETIIVVEAAGYDTVLVETVGVGQSETIVAGMVDFFLVLMLSGAGDELQGIKKGVLELADMVVVNKADGDNEVRAKIAARDYAAALHMMMPSSPNWTTPVLTCSSTLGTGLDAVWRQVELHAEKLGESGERDEKRRNQQIAWLWSMVHDRLAASIRADDAVAALVPGLEAQVLAGELTATVAADRILAAYRG